ncbi:Phage shock protein C (PspC) family protein [Tenacibaculum sp. 190130A14a]|uniref:Phage shock protein C n=1 Tax=Tenacibaculum polynesiense TaxID=3137857 RepID=A0ABP1F0M2_9FLAO
MNKTININLGGFFFHIDEIAYQKLKRYLDAISRSLSDDPQGKEEIIADIETRISELLSERITDARQVINEGDIDEVIAIMGQPEDYTEDEEYATESGSYYNRRNQSSKKLFRDGEDKFLAGVASGLGHYFNVDVIWIRLAFLLLTLAGFGFGVIGYIILWVLLPEAKTTSDKLQMEGEAVNIDNIEKKIRNEFDNLSSKVKEGAHELTDKISNADYQKLRNQTKSGAQDFADTLGKILLTVFKVFGKFMGVLLIFIAGITLISLLFGLFFAGSLEVLNFDGDLVHYPPFFYDSALPKWLLTTFIFLVVGIPFVALFILGLRILSPNLKKIGTPTTLTLLGVWFVAVLGLGFSAVEYGTSRAYDGSNVSKHSITYNQEEPLKIRVVNDDNIYYLHNLRRRGNSIDVNINDKETKYSNNVKIDVAKSETGNAYIEIKKTSEGRRRSKAGDNAKKIVYNFKSANNTIVFDAFYLSEIQNLWKEEEVKATIFIPEGTSLYFEGSSRNFLYGVDNTEGIYDRDMANHHFKMTSKGLECTDCDSDSPEESTNEDDNDSNNDNEVSFMFDSTINDIKAEFIINSSTTKKELEKLIDWFKYKKNIDIDVTNALYDAEDKIKRLRLEINCNDGYEGIINISNNIVKDLPKGFRRLYNEEGNLAFKTW